LSNLRFPSDICPEGYDYTQSNTAKRFAIMRDALLSVNRTILYSLCEWGSAGVQAWGNATGASWRSTGDINANWDRILNILNQNSFYMNNVDFWGHSDPDMLEVGNGNLTVYQDRSHFALWAAMKSPLLIGADLEKISLEQVEVLKNKHLLAFNQDEVFGKPAMPYKWGTNPDWTFNATHPAEFWAGESQQGTLVLMFNPYEVLNQRVADFGEIPGLEEGGSYEVLDVWSGDSLGCRTGSVLANVAAWDTAVLLVKGRCGGGGGRSGGRFAGRKGYIGKGWWG